MGEAADALGRHITRSRYPAIVVLDAPRGGEPDRLPAEIVDPRSDYPDDAARLAVVFDPARFCDVALRVLPPAVLAQRRTFVDWERHERHTYDILKRFFDVCAATVLLLLSSPFMAFAALGILVTDGGPALFRQVRVGRYGKRFRLYKFRTLRDEPPAIGTPNDTIEQRVFRFGGLLRQTRLDELPQFLNVVKGDMSLIGPRPEMEFFHERCVTTIPFYRKRLIVRPGLSGWAQVRFPHTTGEIEYWDKTAYDLWYIAHRNIIVDARIALRTVGVMLFGFGPR
jgi:lipopolysaccharide/colanic/teichoic acid biosynthesis glycosyltransferase